MEENKINLSEEVNNEDENYSLNDDRRVKVLSPGALVAKRFFRNRLAVTGLIILLAMFLFSFVGGLVSPYKQDEKFYTTEVKYKDFGGISINEDFLYSVNDKDLFSGSVQGQAYLAISSGKDKFSYNDVRYEVEKVSDNLYIITAGDKTVGLATTEIVSSSVSNDKFSFDFVYNALRAKNSGTGAFESEGKKYTLDEDGVIWDENGKEISYISNYVVNAVMGDVFLSRRFKTEAVDAVISNSDKFVFTTDDGKQEEYRIEYDAQKNIWNIKNETTVKIFDSYSFPNGEHLLGTDGNGMDMLTRLMYGGRISLMIGFIVVFIESIIGIILGGISGYFGGWVDNLVMRIVDIFYCIPSMPILIIIGAAMDAANLPSLTRMMYLMLILGFIGWPGIARMVRGQILSLREQEFMTATEACGISVRRRIFKHLIPNVIPQLIVIMTMGLGETIIMEATLSFLGLGVRFPFASWGNIISDVNDTWVLTNFWFIWIPAGVLLLATVLAFNIVGDGLRDAFDPKMKR